MKRLLPRDSLEAGRNAYPWGDGEPDGLYRSARDPDAWRFAPIRTQEEVAKILGVSRGTVFNDERSALNKIKAALAPSLSP